MMLFFQFCIPCPGWWSSKFPCYGSVIQRIYENSPPSCHNAENTSAFPILRIPARMWRILRIILHFIMCRYSPCYLRVIAGMWIKCWDFSTLLSQKIPSAFPPHFFHIRMQRFLHVPVWILLAAKMRRSGVRAFTNSFKFSCIPRTIPDWISLLRTTIEVPLLIALSADWAKAPVPLLAYPVAMLPEVRWWPAHSEVSPSAQCCSWRSLYWVPDKTRRDTASLGDSFDKFIELEQLEFLCSENAPTASWLPILSIHIGSLSFQVKTLFSRSIITNPWI